MANMVLDGLVGVQARVQWVARILRCQKSCQLRVVPGPQLATHGPFFDTSLNFLEAWVGDVTRFRDRLAAAPTTVGETGVGN